MKNIHVLPTDNYSLIVYSTSKYGGLFLSKYYSPMKNMGDSYQNIYITSDEEIKEGDWVYNIVSKTKFKATKQLIDLINDPNVTLTTNKKIILTTDQDLIKDGVQAIDDDFLEWFVKNPSCEEVEVTYGVLKPFQSEDKGYLIHCPDNEVLEEPKQLTDLEIAIKLEEIEKEEPTIITDCLDEHGNPEITKRVDEEEELREAAKKYSGIAYDRNDYEEKYYNQQGCDKYDSFVEGAKWQQERMYSKEEVYELFAQWAAYQQGFPIVDEDEIPNGFMSFNQWFKQNKNK